MEEVTLRNIAFFSFGMAILAAVVDMSEAPSQKFQKSGSAQTFDPLWEIIRATGEFEGGFDAVNANLGSPEGLSFGILQWTQGSGSLGKVLQAVQAADPGSFARILGPSWSEVLRAAIDSKDKNVQRAVGGKKLWEEPWLTKFKLLGQVPSLKQGQITAAKQSEFMREALRGAASLGLNPTMHVVGVLFDRAVQNGAYGLRGAVEAVSQEMEEEDTGIEDTSEPLDEDEVLRRVIRKLAGKFRRNTAPSPQDDPKKRWRQVGREWHKFHGTGVDLYLDTLRRGEQAMSNQALRPDVIIT